MEPLEKINEILVATVDNDRFDPTIIKSFKKQLLERGFLTKKQEVALQKIYYGWAVKDKEPTGKAVSGDSGYNDNADYSGEEQPPWDEYEKEAVEKEKDEDVPF